MNHDNDPSDQPFAGSAVSSGAAELFHPSGPMTISAMSQQVNLFSLESESRTGPVVTPCTAQCINLQAMHPRVLERLQLRYKTYYTIIKYEVNPTPNHLGDWVQLAGIGELLPNGTRERVPASFFYINTVMWPN